MEESFRSLLKVLSNKSDQSPWSPELNKFFTQYKSTIIVSEVSINTNESIIEQLSQIFENSQHYSAELIQNALDVLLIFTRDVRCQSKIRSSCLTHLLYFASLKTGCGCYDEPKTNLRALKCLCNLVFQSQTTREAVEALKDLKFESNFAQLLCDKYSSVEAISSCDINVLHFHFSLLFIYTAIAVDSRNFFVFYPNLTDSIGFVIQFLLTALKESPTSRNWDLDARTVLGNVLKTIYTLIANLDATRNKETMQEFLKQLTRDCRAIIMASDLTNPKCFSDEELLTHTYSILGVVPSYALKSSLVQTADPETDSLLPQLYSAIKTAVLTSESSTFKMALFLALGNVCRNCRSVRKYLRFRILPPRKDIHVMPQEGQELKNDLVRLMMGTNREIGELVSEFVFVLCKENVNRLLKYTGYGNAAGMMFNRGLGLRSRPPSDYSEDEDTDTEEFKQHHHGFNYVTGRYEPPKADPFEGMSEERKLVETEKLFNAMARMEGSSFEPMTMGPDGRPVPMMREMARRAHEREDTPPEEDSD